MSEPALSAPRLVDAGDIRLSVREYGSGPALVWLHGSGPGASGLSNFGANLPAFPDFRNIVFDLPRFGASDRPHIEGDLIAHASERVIRALDGMGVERFSLLGNSFGGGVSTRIAGTVPDRVEHLILMAPAGIPFTGDLPVGLQIIIRAMTKVPDEAVMREFIETMVYDTSLVTPELVQERLTAAVANHPELEGRPPLMGAVADIIPAVTAHTLLLWGSSDRFIPVVQAMEWLQVLPEADLHVFARCGHWAQRERLDDFNAIVRQFVGATSGEPVS